ncbi:MAG: hypothetical protein RSE38_00725 [Acinetobacter sp.]
MKDEADNKTLDWVGHKIELVRFEGGLADFEIGDLTARCSISDWDLGEFVEGQLLIKPCAWFDMNDDEVAKPEWFGRKELFELNNVFERDFKKFRG